MKDIGFTHDLYNPLIGAEGRHFSFQSPKIFDDPKYIETASELWQHLLSNK